MTYTTDNRFSAGNSRSQPIKEPAAMYGARWIDQGDLYPADIVPDRQGFAYNDEADRDRLIDALNRHNKVIRQIGDLGRDDVTVYNLPYDGAVLCVGQRRAGGYVYVDAWLDTIKGDTVIKPEWGAPVRALARDAYWYACRPQGRRRQHRPVAVRPRLRRPRPRLRPRRHTPAVNPRRLQRLRSCLTTTPQTTAGHTTTSSPTTTTPTNGATTSTPAGSSTPAPTPRKENPE